MSGFTLDAGALIAAERGQARMVALLDRAARRGLPIAIPAGVVGQVWRAQPAQHRFHLLLGDDSVEVPALDRDEALAAGALCARARTSDVIDASVALCAQRRRQAVITSDPDNIRRLDPRLAIIAI